MNEPIPSRSMQQELVKALGLPLDGCIEAEIEMPSDGAASVVVRYYLTPDALLAAAEAMNKAVKP